MSDQSQNQGQPTQPSQTQQNQPVGDNIEETVPDEVEQGRTAADDARKAQRGQSQRQGDK